MARVTQERCSVPPDRFISVSDAALVGYFQGVFPGDQAEQVSLLHQMLDGLSGQELTHIRRRLVGEFGFFAGAAAGRSAPEGGGAWKDVDAQEAQFLSDFWEMMQAAHYKMLGKEEWESALSEDFLFTLPVSVNYDAMDSGLLKRWWAQGGRESIRGGAPEELADRCLVFYRGVEEAHIAGHYWWIKLEYLASFFILQPLWRLVAKLLALSWVRTLITSLLSKLRLSSMSAPTSGMHLFSAAAAGREAGEGGGALAPEHSAHSAAPALAHPHAVSVERRTFARVFPDGPTVLRQLFKRVKLQEACFRDVIILYRSTISEEKPGEFDILNATDPAVLARNIHIKHFKGVPLSDLDLVLPEKTVFVPPTVLLQLAATVVLGLVALVGALTQGLLQDTLNVSAVWSAAALLGARALQIYSSAQETRTAIEKQMSKILYERTAASQEAVLQMLTEEMSKQRVRELFVCYCILLNSPKPLTATELDERCEAFLARQFGLRIDFTTEAAVPALASWGLVAEAEGGALQAAPLHMALERLDAIWDALFDFSEGPVLAPATPTGTPRAAEAATQPPPVPGAQQLQRRGSLDRTRRLLSTRFRLPSLRTSKRRAAEHAAAAATAAAGAQQAQHHAALHAVEE